MLTAVSALAQMTRRATRYLCDENFVGIGVLLSKRCPRKAAAGANLTPEHEPTTQSSTVLILLSAMNRPDPCGKPDFRRSPRLALKKGLTRHFASCLPDHHEFPRRDILTNCAITGRGEQWCRLETGQRQRCSGARRRIIVVEISVRSR